MLLCRLCLCQPHHPHFSSYGGPACAPQAPPPEGKEDVHWACKRCKLHPPPAMVLPSAGSCLGSPSPLAFCQSSCCPAVWASAGHLKECCCSTEASLDVGRGEQATCTVSSVITQNWSAFLTVGRREHKAPEATVSPVSEDQKASSLCEENSFKTPSSWSPSSSLWLCVFWPLPLPNFSASFCHLCLFTVPKTMFWTLN